jgi:hypothetical protein
MNLHENKDDFRVLVSLTADYLKMPEVFIEKDYWVTYLLYNLSKSDVCDKVVFKGGTSLSKAYKFIDRFSEDVDLVILNPDINTLNQNKALLSKIPKKIALEPLKYLGDEHPSFRDSKGYKKRVYSYEKLDENQIDYGHATSELILEVNFFAKPSPINVLPIQTYIYDFIDSSPDVPTKTISEYGLEPFDLNILCTTRTFFEKVVSLYRGAHRSKDILKSRIRHFYDIYMLSIKDEKIQKILKDDMELKLHLNNVIQDEKGHEMFCDIEDFLPLSESIFSKKIKSYKEELEKIYKGNFASMVYKRDKLPNFHDVYQVVEKLNEFIIKNKI